MTDPAAGPKLERGYVNWNSTANASNEDCTGRASEPNEFLEGWGLAEELYGKKKKGGGPGAEKEGVGARAFPGRVMFFRSFAGTPLRFGDKLTRSKGSTFNFPALFCGREYLLTILALSMVTASAYERGPRKKKTSHCRPEGRRLRHGREKETLPLPAAGPGRRAGDQRLRET